MKTLIINGSPRKNGDTAALINEMKRCLDGEVKVISAYYDKISPCTDCRHCWSNPKCAINDRMQEVYNDLNEVDNVIIASPLYFSELSGPLLSLASRFQLFYASKYIRKDKNFALKNKNGVLILTGGGSTKDLDKAMSTASTIFKHINTNLVDTVCSLNTDNIPAKEDSAALKKAREAALKLNELYWDRHN